MLFLCAGALVIAVFIYALNLVLVPNNADSNPVLPRTNINTAEQPQSGTSTGESLARPSNQSMHAVPVMATVNTAAIPAE